jgi:hypothetical protein
VTKKIGCYDSAVTSHKSSVDDDDEDDMDATADEPDDTDARDAEIVRLRAALRRASEAAMAYADSHAKALDAFREKLEAMELDAARRAKEDAATIAELRRALAKTCEERGGETIGGARDSDEVEGLRLRLAETARERDEALESLANAVRLRPASMNDDDDDDNVTSYIQNDDPTHRPPTDSSSLNLAEVESARERCDVAERALRELRDEGLLLADEAARASARCVALGNYVSQSREDISELAALVASRRAARIGASS